MHNNASHRVNYFTSKTFHLLILLFCSFAASAYAERPELTCQHRESGDIIKVTLPIDVDFDSTSYAHIRHVYCKNVVFKEHREAIIAEEKKTFPNFRTTNREQHNDVYARETWIEDSVWGYYPFSYSAIGYAPKCYHPFYPDDETSSCITYCPANEPLDLNLGICRPGPGKYKPKQCSENALNPINVSNGEKDQKFSSDFSLPGEFPLILTRTYGSKKAPELKHSQLKLYPEESENKVRYVQPTTYKGPKYKVYDI